MTDSTKAAKHKAVLNDCPVMHSPCGVYTRQATCRIQVSAVHSRDGDFTMWNMWGETEGRGGQAIQEAAGMTPVETPEYLGQVETVHEGALRLAFHALDVLCYRQQWGTLPPAAQPRPTVQQGHCSSTP